MVMGSKSVRRAGRRGGNVAVGVVLAVAAVVVAPPPANAKAAAATTTITRVSLTGSGAQANGGSYSNAMTPDGRYVAFVSSASNLVPGDTNDEWDVFVRDTHTGAVERVSVANDGTQSNGYTFHPDISDDGNRVSFSSLGSDLVAGDTNGTDGYAHDVFVRDRRAGTTERVNVASDGSQDTDSGGWIASSISGNGKYVAFTSRAPNLVVGDTNGVHDVFVRDLDRDITTRVSVSSTVPPLPGVEGVGASLRGSMSFDGRYVAFESLAPNLVLGDTNMAYDIFVHDRLEATTTRVSVANDGSEGQSIGSRVGVVPAISADGVTVAFNSPAHNLVNGDTNGTYDVFVRHLRSATTTRVSVASNGTQGNFQSGGDNTSRVAAVSDDGNRVAFRSLATNLVTGDTNRSEDVFVHDLRTAVTTRASAAGDGTQANGVSAMPSITADGRYVAFGSGASNLVAGDTNGSDDIFVRDTAMAQ